MAVGRHMKTHKYFNLNVPVAQRNLEYACSQLALACDVFWNLKRKRERLLLTLGQWKLGS